MENFRVNVQVIKTYSLWVAASSEEDAVNQVKNLTSLEISDVGSLDDVTVDYIEVVDKEDE